MTSSLKLPIAQLADWSRVQQYRGLRLSESDIAFSTASGMDARDVRTMRELTGARSLAIVVRCPKQESRVMQGVFPAKTAAVKAKSGSHGVVQVGTREGGDLALYVSDYDLMGIWRHEGGRWRPLPMRNFPGAFDATTSFEAWAVLRALNQRLVAPIQHGCQDDYRDAKNPGVSGKDHFAVFDRGGAEHLSSFAECARRYRRAGWAWRYEATGRFCWPPRPAAARAAAAAAASANGARTAG